MGTSKRLRNSSTLISFKFAHTFLGSLLPFLI
jgi:hypothetical protein